MYQLSIDKNFQEIWKYESDDLEEIAGMASSAQPIISDLNKNSMAPLILKCNVSLKNFRVINNIPSELLEKYKCRDLSDDGFEICNVIFSLIGDNAGVWVNSGNNRGIGYSLYVFKTHSFLRGMIKFSQLFDEDFRNYIYETPFFSDSTEYKLPEKDGYKFQKNEIYRVTPIDMELDMEEAGDDNVQNPYQNNDYYNNS